jgi:hypothetical protein
VIDLPALAKLFQDPSMFDSREHWQKAGFFVMREGNKSDVMVASHPTITDYLFKKYNRSVDLKDQRRNYKTRIEGADAVRERIQKKGLPKLVVPRKYLLPLPAAFERKGRRAYVLVVERMELVKDAESKRLYGNVSDETIRQLCTMVRKYPGLDSDVRNLPFTTSGKIAFIDTERWQRYDMPTLKYICQYLPKRQCNLVKELL